MFTYGKLLIKQQKRDAVGRLVEVSVEVNLRKPRRGGLPFYGATGTYDGINGEEDPNLERLSQRWGDGWLWWGRWTNGVNNVTNSVDLHYTVGSSDRLYWHYNVQSCLLQFVQRNRQTARDKEGAAGAYEATYEPSLELKYAHITAHGFVPRDPDHTEGIVTMATPLFEKAAVSWERLSNL